MVKTDTKKVAYNIEVLVTFYWIVFCEMVAVSDQTVLDLLATLHKGNILTGVMWQICQLFEVTLLDC